MSVDEVKATIRQGTEAAREGIKRLRQLATDSAETNELARRTTEGSRDDDVITGLALLADVQGEVERTVRRLATAVDHAETYAKRLG
ncbi:hypothetical protein ABGB07_36950 [Micromonosporaceae bacterium B7E4]